MQSDQNEVQNVRNNALRFSPSIGPDKLTEPCIVSTRIYPDWSFSITRDQMAKSTVLNLAFSLLFVMLSPSVKSEVKFVEWNPNPTVASLS